MALFQSDYAKGILAVPYPSLAGQAVTHRYAMSIPSGAALNDIFELACIPANCRVADLVLDADDLDTGGSPAIALDVGVMSGNWGENDSGRTCGDEFLDGVTTGQAGGVVRPTLAKAFRTGGAGVDRSIGVKIATAAATGQAGVVGLTVTVVAV